MNTFEESFYKKYLPENVEIHYVIHKHLISILGRVVVFMSLFVIIPSFYYYLSYRLKDIIPFYYFETYLFITFLKIVYDLFDWYLDCWLVTNEGIYSIKWKLFKSEVNSVNYENIEGIEIEQNGINDKLMKKGNLIIHKIGDDVFRLSDVSNPYYAADQIERNSEVEAEDDTDKDRFELMMETLSGVVNDYLERNGGGTKKHHPKSEEYEKKIEGKTGTIDLR